ncbi:hypothetical protein C8J57DRAFT_1636786 [Mycena rebaudengoi]|nr:hypothetical protein C8J57DRAFT_1636786 [Mycena rebaudengoi]
MQPVIDVATIHNRSHFPPRRLEQPSNWCIEPPRVLPSTTALVCGAPRSPHLCHPAALHHQTTPSPAPSHAPSCIARTILFSSPCPRRALHHHPLPASASGPLTLHVTLCMMHHAFTLGELGLTCFGGTAVFAEYLATTIAQLPRRAGAVPSHPRPSASPPASSPASPCSSVDPSLRASSRGGPRPLAAAGALRWHSRVGAGLLVLGPIALWSRWYLGGRDPWLWVLQAVFVGSWHSRVALVVYWGVLGGLRRKFFYALIVVMFVPGVAFDHAFTHLAFSTACALHLRQVHPPLRNRAQCMSACRTANNISNTSFMMMPEESLKLSRRRLCGRPTPARPGAATPCQLLCSPPLTLTLSTTLSTIYPGTYEHVLDSLTN